MTKSVHRTRRLAITLRLIWLLAMFLIWLVPSRILTLHSTGGYPEGTYRIWSLGGAALFPALEVWQRLPTTSSQLGPAWSIEVRPVGLGIAIVLTLGVSAWLWRCDRLGALTVRGSRQRRGCCPRCGYDLHGAAHTHCPECGEAVDRPSSPCGGPA